MIIVIDFARELGKQKNSLSGLFIPFSLKEDKFDYLYSTRYFASHRAYSKRKQNIDYLSLEESSARGTSTYNIPTHSIYIKLNSIEKHAQTVPKS